MAGTRLVFEVLQGELTLAGEKFPAGENVVEKASAELVKHAGSAHAAGVAVVTEGLDVSHVQSQEDGEKAYEEALATGSWYEGQTVQAALDHVEKERQRAETHAEEEVQRASEEGKEYEPSDFQARPFFVREDPLDGDGRLVAVDPLEVIAAFEKETDK